MMSTNQYKRMLGLKFIWVVVVFGLVAGLINQSAGAEANRELEVLQSHADRLVTVLANRMIVIVQEVHTSPVVSAQVWVKTGSIYEQEHVGAGLSHFLEHLLAAGSTSTRTEEETNAILGRIGAQTNAATSMDTVRYYINTISGHTAEAVELLSDWMQNSLITEVEYKREREVIQREFEMGEGDPGRIFWKLTQQARYRAHPARHPTIGYLDEFLTISRDQIYDFYKRMYVPNNMVFVVVGDVDKKKVTEQIASLWKDAQARELPKLAFPLEPEISEPRGLSGTADVRRPRLRLTWPGTRLAQEGDFALDLLATILGQGESSRLVRSVRDEQRSVTTITAYNMSMHWGEGSFGIDCEVAGEPGGFEAATRRATDGILAQVEKIKTEGVTEQELARAKRQTIARVVYEAQTADGLAGRLAGDMVGMADPDYLQRYSLAVESITAEEVKKVANQFLAPSRLITLTLAPAGPGQPPEKLARPKDEVDASKLPSAAVELDNESLVNRYRAMKDSLPAQANGGGAEGIERHVLANGLRVLVCRNAALPVVAMQVYEAGGLLADEPGRQGLANAAAAMMIKGTKTRSAEEIARQAEDLGAGLTVECGNNSLYSRAICLKQDWRTILNLQADVLLNPTFPEDQWQKLQPRLLAAIDRQRDRWNGELRLAFLKAYFGDHPWSVTPAGKRDVVAGLKAEDLRKFHQEHLDASQTVVAVFGDVEPAEVIAQIERLYAGLPGKAVKTIELIQPKQAGEKQIEVKTQKPLAAVQIGYGPGMVRSNPDYGAMEVVTKVLSSFPSGWLERELRGKGPGLVYSVGAGQGTGLVPGYFTVLFNTQPEQVGEALERARSQIERVKTELVDEADLERAKAAVLADEFLGKQSNPGRAADAALNELYGLGLDEPERFLKQVSGITAEQVRAAAKTYLQNPVTVVLTHEPAGEGK